MKADRDPQSLGLVDRLALRPKEASGPVQNHAAVAMYLTPNQLARRTGVGAHLIRAAIRAGELPASTFGGRWFRVRRSDFDAWAEKTRVEPASDVVVERVGETIRKEEAL